MLQVKRKRKLGTKTLMTALVRCQFSSIVKRPPAILQSPLAKHQRILTEANMVFTREGELNTSDLADPMIMAIMTSQ